MVAVNGIHSNGHMSNGNVTYLPCSSDYEERPTIDVVAREPKPGWHDQNPRFVHSLTWTDADGVGHMLVLRSDDLQALFGDIKMVKSMIKRSKEKAKEKQPEAQQEQTQPEHVVCKIHGVQMERRVSKRTGGHYFSHRIGTELCFGKGAK